MKIIAGLGNPGPKYETTRHNAGFLATDRLIDAWKAVKSKGAQGFHGEVYETSVGAAKVIIVKPKTYMNESGKCVGALFKFYKRNPEDLIVIHDDLDLPPLTLRIKTGGGTGGHKGLKSIDDHLGKESTNYHRLRIGIGKPSGDSGRVSLANNVVDYVLERFSDEELKHLDAVLDDVVAAAVMLIHGEAAKAMNKFNKKTPPETIPETTKV